MYSIHTNDVLNNRFSSLKKVWGKSWLWIFGQKTAQSQFQKKGDKIWLADGGYSLEFL